MNHASRHFQALSVDLDGTLADTGALFKGLWRHFLRHPRVLGAYRETFEELRTARSRDIDAALLEGVCRRSGATPEAATAILDEALGKSWEARFAKARPISCVVEVLRQAANHGLPVAVVSDHDPRGKLDAMGISELACCQVSCRWLGAPKPHPDGLVAAASQLGVPPARMLSIGDRWDTDGLAAARAGCTFVAVDALDSTIQIAVGPGGFDVVDQLQAR